MAIGAILGVAQAGLGIMGAISGNSAQQAQVDAQNMQAKLDMEARNKAAVEQYKQQLYIQDLNFTNAGSAFTQKVGTYNQQINNLNTQTGVTYQAEQMRLNELMKQFKFTREADEINEMQAVAKVSAGGQTGRTAGRMQALTAASFGRKQAQQRERMLGETYASEMRNEATYRADVSSRRALQSQVANGPMQGIDPTAPTMASANLAAGPSPMSMIAGIGNSIMGGVTSGINMQTSLNNLKTSQQG